MTSWPPGYQSVILVNFWAQTALKEKRVKQSLLHNCAKVHLFLREKKKRHMFNYYTYFESISVFSIILEILLKFPLPITLPWRLKWRDSRWIVSQYTTGRTKCNWLCNDWVVERPIKAWQYRYHLPVYTPQGRRNSKKKNWEVGEERKNCSYLVPGEISINWNIYIIEL